MMNKQELITDPSEMVVAQPEALTNINESIATARQFPRDSEVVDKKITGLVTSSVEVAQSLWYAKPVGTNKETGKTEYAYGWSIRMAEILASTWGNLRVASRIHPPSATQISAEAIAWDLETNSQQQITCIESILTRHRKRVGEEMIINKGKVAQAKARRDAIIAVIGKANLLPFSIQRQEYLTKQLGKGDDEKLKATIARMVEWFAKQGITEEHEMLYLAGGTVESIEQLGWDEIMKLGDCRSALEDKSETVDSLLTEYRLEQQADAADESDESKPLGEQLD